jgi:putative ATP-binding cassette transporter
MLFLPQRPYMLLGSLREQICYPAMKSTLTDVQLQALLDEVDLPDLAGRHGGFDTVIDWSRVLSLGEQQRIGFARVLLARPEIVFLDEATSALDEAGEAALYRMLREADWRPTIVSVGHHGTLRRFHETIVDLGQRNITEAADG